MMEAALLADRVVVLGGRPARITTTIKVGLPRPRSPEESRISELHRKIIVSLT